MRHIRSIFILFLFAGGLFSACRKADPIIRNTSNQLSDIYATLEGKGGERLFDARYSANKDTVYFDIPYFFPVDSDNEVDLTKLILRATIPADAIMTPALGTIMDLSKPVTAEIISGSGERSTFVIVAKKVGDAVLRSAKIAIEVDGATEEIEGIIQESEVLFYVLPGTDMTKAKLSLAINRHSTSSIANGGEIDLSQDVPLTITGVDGSKKTYTLRAVEPVKLDYGIGINRKMWVKSAAELGFTANMEVGLAVSGDYLVMVNRSSPSKYIVLNRFTGAQVGQMTLPFSGLSFQAVEDTVGNILGASWAPKNSTFYLYKWKNPFDPSPVKMVQWVNNNPAGITGDGGVGRRVNIYGDLDKDAVIMATAGQSKIIYKWIVRNGAVVSQTPEIIEYKSVAGGSTTFMGYYAEAQPVSAAANTDYFVNYQFEIALVNGTTNERVTAVSNEASAYGVFHMPTAYTRFNNANYLAIVKYMDTYSLNKVRMSLLDVTSTSNISIPASDARFPKLNVFDSELLNGTANANGTADICVTFSPDKERMQVYMLLTNGGIMAHEFTKYAP